MGKPVSELSIGVDQGTTNAIGGMMRRLSMKVAQIRNVHAETNTVDLQWLWPIRGGANGVEISRPYVGFRSGIHFVPEVGSVVIIGYAFNQTVMLSYLMPSDYSKLLDGYSDNNGVPSRIRQMSPGEISLNSLQDSEIYLHEQVEITDPNGDSIVIDPNDSSINLSSLIFYMDNDAGNITMGPVTRNGKIITSDGLPVLSSNGGNALTELSITVEKFSNGTIFDDTKNKNLVVATIGTLVDGDGLQVINNAGNHIVTNIDLSSGANLNIDSEGNFNLNDGNMLKPLDIPAIPTPLLTTSTGNTFVFTTQQRAAREGDRIVIPMSIPTTSIETHPDLLNKATFNIQQLQQIAGMIMTPYGPCVAFIPTAPDARLVGAITQGSDSVFIGSIDKEAESKETKDNTL